MSYKYKQCPSCFELSKVSYAVCPFCATDLTAVNYHPWRRLFARLLDLSFILTAWFLVVAVVFIFLNLSEEEQADFRQIAHHFDHPIISYPILGTVYIFTETVILSLFGTTPGKKIYRIKLIYKSGKPSFWVALKRTFTVWSVGMALTIPVVSLYAFYMARKRLVKTGVALWDAAGGFRVTHGQWGVLYSVWVILVSAVFYVVLIGIYSGEAS